MLMRRGVLAGILLAAAITVPGCAMHGSSLSDLPVSEFSGHYVGAQGESWFRPCGTPAADPSWWVTFTDRSVAQADEARSAGRLVPGKSYFVRFRAAVTTGGEIGPQGPGARALLVREILELREGGESDCAG